MFAALQVETAKVLGISTVIIAAAQSVGGSIGGAISPAKVLLGATMVGLDGGESEVNQRARSAAESEDPCIARTKMKTLSAA